MEVIDLLVSFLLPCEWFCFGCLMLMRDLGREAYVHGIMYGEGLVDEKGQKREF